LLLPGITEIIEHILRPPEENHPASVVQQDRFVKHVEEPRARLMDTDKNDFVMRQAAHDFEDMF
jgi:hypothetical protein